MTAEESASVSDVTDDTKVDPKFQGLVEAAPEAIVAVDAAGVIRVVNRQSEDLFGYDHDELIEVPRG